jgi:5'-nucleotidase
VSLTSKAGKHYETAARVARELIAKHGERLRAQPVLLNVNVPDAPYESIAGYEVTRLGKRHKAEGVIKTRTPRGDEVYWIGSAGAAQDAGPGTDFHAVAANRVSITPLQMDLTHAPQIPHVKAWFA